MTRAVYEHLLVAADASQRAVYALEEAHYRSSLHNIADAKMALDEAQRMIEAEIEKSKLPTAP